MFQNEQERSLILFFRLHLESYKAYVLLLYLYDFTFYFTAKLWLSFQLSLTVLLRYRYWLIFSFRGY